MKIESQQNGEWGVINIATTQEDYQSYEYDFFSRLNQSEEQQNIPQLDNLIEQMFNEAKSDYKKLTELVIVLNHKMWQKSEENNIPLGKLYQLRYQTYNQYAWDNLKGTELDYYFEKTD